MIKLAVPTRAGQVDEHFGHCESFTIYAIDDTKAVVGQQAEHVEVFARGQQLHADLVEGHRVAEPVDPLHRLGAAGHVEGEDQPFARGQRQRASAHGATSSAARLAARRASRGCA